MAPDDFYQQVRQEVDNNDLKEKLWLRCYAQSKGNEHHALSLYLQQRTNELYRENTSFFRRLAHEVPQALHYQTKLGKRVIAGSIVGGIFLIFLMFQPFLHRRAEAACSQKWEKVRHADFLGQKSEALFKVIGWPGKTTTTDGSLVYLYNDSSIFCWGRSRYELRVHALNGVLMGFEEPLAMRKP